MSIIFLGGINGVGKSSVAQELCRRINIQALHGTTELMNSLGIVLGDYATLQNLPEVIKEQAFENVFRSLVGGRKKDITLVTGHYAKILQGEILPSYGGWYGYCDLLVALVSSPHEILHRITDDESSGKRATRNVFGERIVTPLERMAFLENAQYVSEKVMRQASKEFRVPSFCIRNTDRQLFNVVGRLVQIIEKRL